VKLCNEKDVPVIFQFGRGKAGAIRTAIDSVTTPYMLVMDADFTYDPKDIANLLPYSSVSDEVIGLRQNREHIPFLHRFGNRILSVAFSMLSGQRLSDPCSGMYLLKVDSARKLELSSGGFDVEAEIAGQLASYGKVAEVPISYRERLGPGKLGTWRSGFNILAAIFRVTWLNNPILLFSAIAALFTFPGSAILLWQLLLRSLYGEAVWSIGWTWLGLFFLIVGLQGFSTTTITLILKRMERRIIQATGQVR
jgi:dolichol-phosphate mannosyltransferase